MIIEGADFMTGKVDFQLPQEVLEMYKELTAVQELHSNIQVVTGTVTDKQLSDHFQQKIPLLSFIPPSVNRKAFNEVLIEVSRVTKKFRPSINKKVDKIADFLMQTDDFDEIISRLIWQEDVKVEKLLIGSRVDKKLFFFLAINTLRPFMISYGKKLSEHNNNELWKQNYCPVCGWQPIMAMIVGENHFRHLHCSLCATEWEYKRLACVNCQNADHEKLKSFNVEGDEVYQVSVCDECNSYVKILDVNKLITKPNVLLADIETLYLDILAEREGYSKGTSIKSGDSH